MYQIEFNDRRRLFVLTVQGFWTLATVAGFSASLLARAGTVRVRHGKFAMLVDARDFPVQAAEIVRALELVAGKAFLLSDGPYATAVSSVLTKFQGERVLNGPNCRTFMDMAAATAWIDETWLTASPALAESA